MQRKLKHVSALPISINAVIIRSTSDVWEESAPITVSGICGRKNRSGGGKLGKSGLSNNIEAWGL